MSIPWSRVGTTCKAPVDTCVVKVEGGMVAQEVTGAGLAVTRAQFPLPEVTPFLRGAFQTDNDF